MDDKSKQLIIENIPFFNDFALRVNSFQNTKIDTIRIIYFLSQFDGFQEIQVILKLIKKIDFLNSQMITYLLKSAYNKIEADFLEKPIISSLGGIQDSSAVVCYQLLKDLFDDESETLQKVINIDMIGEDLLKEDITAIILFDDNITSGTQLENFFNELIIGCENPEFFKKPLSQKEIDVLKNIPIRICYAIQLAESSNSVIERIKTTHNLDLKVYSGRVDYTNYLDFHSNIFESEEESNFSKKFISEIAVKLYEDKDWSKETVYNRILGYGNLGKLTVFYYNVPKSLIPIFWKFGYFDNKPWFPLFPETQEQKKNIKSNQQFDYYRIEAIKSWISSGVNSRTPNLEFGIFSIGSVLKEIVLKVPSKKYITEKYLSKISPKKLNYIENRVSTRPRMHLSVNNYLNSVLSTSDYEKYKKAIDSYNTALVNFHSELEIFLFQLSSSKNIEFILKNEGNTSATNIITKIFYNSGIIVPIDIQDFSPQFNEKIPNINDFYRAPIGQITIVNPTMDNNYPKISKKHENLIPNTNYELKIENARLGHNDSYRKKILLTRIDFNQPSIELTYEINYDQDPNTHSGKIKLYYEEEDKIDVEINEKVESEILRFRQILNIN